MQAAFARLAALPPPPSRTLVIAGLHRARARRAPNAGETLVMQCIVGQSLPADVLPDFLFSPLEQRADLVQAVFAIPCHGRRHGTPRRLGAPDAGDPGAATGDSASERFHFANGATSATLIDSISKSVDAVRVHPTLQIGRFGIVDAQGASVALLHALDEIVGLGEEAPGVDAENLDRGQRAGVDSFHRSPNEVREDHGLRA